MDREVYEFGMFRVDAAARRLTRDGVEVPIQPKPFELLLLLLRHDGQAVSHEQIRQHLWPDVAVTDASLRQTVLKVREVVGAGLVQTVPRHGLRWAGGSSRRVLEGAPSAELPFERDAFVGRAGDLALLEGLLDGMDRLVTLTGPGGVGKTRLALRHARSLQRRWPGRVYFCDLSEARDDQQIRQVVGQATGIALTRPDADRQLADALQGRGECLVILDNFEQIAGYAGRTVGRWLDGTERARFLVTSRGVLGLPGERVLSLRPLQEAEALELFAVRAASARQDFALDETSLPVARALVRLLDGLPLAIELAAARVRVLSLEALRSRLGDQLALLGCRGERPARHKTLRATLDWSWALLSPPERSALAQCAVFEGGFTVEAAEAVLALPDALPVVDALQALVDQSMVQRAAEGRLSLLSSVQAYAAEQLEALGLRAEVEARHGAHYAALGRDEDVLGGGPSRELGNVVAACRRAVARKDAAVAVGTLIAAHDHLERTGPVALGLELAEATAAMALSAADRALVLRLRGSALQSAGRLREAVEVLEAALQAHRALEDRRGEGRALLVLGIALLGLGRIEEARAQQERALAAFLEVGDRRGQGIALTNLGVTYQEQHDMAQARARYEAALILHREVGNRASEHLVLGNLGNLHLSQGRLDEARAHLEAALAFHREVGDRSSEATVLGNLAVLAAYRSTLDEARAYLEAALAAHREVGDRHGQVTALGNLGALDHKQGRPEAAARLEEALAVTRQVGDRAKEGFLLGNLAFIRHDQGQLDLARPLYEAALALHREVGNRRSEGTALGGLGDLHRDQGRPELARQCYEAALALHREVGNRLYEATLYGQVARLEAQTGDCARALALLERSERLLTELQDREELGRLQALRAEVCWRSGDLDAARSALSAAMAGAPGYAQVEREIARVRALLDAQGA